jgi:hypothetical protein
VRRVLEGWVGGGLEGGEDEKSRERERLCISGRRSSGLDWVVDCR